MNRYFLFVFFSGVISMLSYCADTSSNAKPLAGKPAPDPVFTPISLPKEFNDYWYQGKAELSSYEVVQERYGEIRRAEQVIVFVTEDVSKSKQVKLDDPDRANSDRVPVLKMNSIRRFETGIYDYSLMQSVFTPISGMATLKTSTTVQDWCGQVFMQMNLGAKGYRARIFSYFESEGDLDVELPFVLLEDDLLTRIRLNPYSIETGKTKMLPSAIYARLRHKPLTAQDADIQVVRGEKSASLSLSYLTIARTVKINFETNFPYKILSWEETNDGKLASKGVLKASRRSAYWAEHDNVHAPLRDSLLLGHMTSPKQ